MTTFGVVSDCVEPLKILTEIDLWDLHLPVRGCCQRSCAHSGGDWPGLTWARRSWHHACFQLWLPSECGGVCAPHRENRSSRVSEAAKGVTEMTKKCEYATVHALYVNETMSWLRRSGESITLVTREDWRVASELITILERSGQVITPADIHSFHYVCLALLCKECKSLTSG